MALRRMYTLSYSGIYLTPFPCFTKTAESLSPHLGILDQFLTVLKGKMTHVINVNNLPDSVKAQHMIISATRTAPLLCTTSHFCSRVILVKISLKGSMWGMRLRTFPKELMYTLLWKESSKAITNNHHLWTGKRMIGSAMNVCFCSSENIYTFGCWRKKRK